MKPKTLAIFIAMCLIIGQTVSGAQNQEKWQEPNAWAKEVEVSSLQTMDKEFCMCNAGDPADPSSSNQAAVFILKKFIRYIFNREKLEYDEHYSLYQRELLFTILPAQLEKLEQLSDPRDLDSVLTEIFVNTRTPNKFNRSNGTWTSIFALIWDILKDLVMLLRFSEVQFIVFVLSFIMFVWFIHKRHNVRIVMVIVGGFLVFGYFVTYLECNRELEIKQMLEVIEKNEAAKPREPRWYTPITNWFSSSEEVSKTERREQLKKASKLNLAFCRPDHVLILYGNELFLKQLEFFIEKCITTLSNVNYSLSWPYNWIAACGLMLIILYIIKLTFKHILSPRAWIGYFHHSRSPPLSESRGQTPESLAYREDCLSGENLKALLSVIKAPNVFINNSNIPTGSCVQDLPLEALKQQSDNSHSSSNSNNNSSTSDSSHSKSIASECDSPQKLSSPNVLMERVASEGDSPQKSSSPNDSMETVAAELEATAEVSSKSDADFVLISQVESKVTLEDLPED